MKNIVLIFIATFAFSCKAQTPIKSLYDDRLGITGAYYKDLYNDLDNFAGTWKYTNGTTSLTITLQKKEMHHFVNGNLDYYLDMLIGEYQYIENGIEKINTLPILSTNDGWDHNIVGSIIIGPNSQYCMGCGSNDRKLLLGFIDPTRSIFGFRPEMIFQRADDANVQKVKLVFRNMGVRMKRLGETEYSPYTSYTVPFGEYIMVKQ